MSDTNTPSELTPPDDFGAEIAAVFAQRQTRSFDPTAQRGAVDGGDQWAGITFGDDGASVDAFEQLAAQLNKEAIAERSPVVEPKIITEPADTTPLPPPSPEAPDTASQPASEELPPPTLLPPPAAPETVEQQPPGVDGHQESSDPGVPPPTGYAWTLGNGEQTLHFSDEQVQMALALTEWAQNLPEPTRQAIAAIEDGQAVAIPRADFDQFVAWRNGQTKQQRDRDLEQYDPEAAAEIARLRDENNQLKSTPPPPPQYNNLNANLDNSANIYDAALTKYAQDNQLTPPEMDALTDVMVRNKFVAGIAAAHTVWNPVTQQIIRPADPAVVLPQALDAALALNPQLFNAVQARRQQPPATAAVTTQSSPPSPTGTALATEPTVDPVVAKRARAASVASAPSAAAAPAPRSKVLTGDALVRAMAAELAPLMGRDDDFAHVSAPTVL